MKRASEAMENIASPSASIDAPTECPECGKTIAIKVLVGPVSQFPVLECLSQIIICNECADFRYAFSDCEESISRLLRWYRIRLGNLLAKKLEEAAERQKMQELRSAVEGELTNRVRRFGRIVSRRSGHDGIPTEALKERLLEVMESRLSYDGENSRYVASYDESVPKLRRFAGEHGVVIVNHWKDAGPP